MAVVGGLKEGVQSESKLGLSKHGPFFSNENSSQVQQQRKNTLERTKKQDEAAHISHS